MKVTESSAFTESDHPAVEYVYTFWVISWPRLISHSTVGAGDTLIAGVLFGLNCHVKDWSLERTLNFANELAGRKVQQEGFAGVGRLMLHSVSTRREKPS